MESGEPRGRDPGSSAGARSQFPLWSGRLTCQTHSRQILDDSWGSIYSTWVTFIFRDEEWNLRNRSSALTEEVKRATRRSNELSYLNPAEDPNMQNSAVVLVLRVLF